MISCYSFGSPVIRVCIAMNKSVAYNHFRTLCSNHELPKLTSIMFKNPCLDLEQCVEVPLLKDKDCAFVSTFESMKASMEMFLPHEENQISRIKCTIDPKKFPSHNLPEIAFLGRSNAGKTSILKAIFSSVPELRIASSHKPGHTKSLKFYQVGSRLCLVDMPGYGFRQPEWFHTSVIPYLKKRRNLVKTFFLIDATEGFHSWDDASLQMLTDLSISFAVVLTKIDLVTDSQRLRNFLHLRSIINDLNVNTCFPQIFMLSTETLEGLAYFTSFIAHVTGNLDPKMSNSSREFLL